MNDETISRERSKQSKQSDRLERLFVAPVSRKTPLGTDTAWALKLKDAVDTVVRELHVEVRAAKPMQAFELPDPNDMLFEIETDKGMLQAIRTRSGKFNFRWM